MKKQESIIRVEGVIMRIEGMINNPNMYSNIQLQEPPVIDVNEIKSILYLGLKGNIKIDVEEKHTIDTFA